jgi:hypothetical protein
VSEKSNSDVGAKYVWKERCPFIGWDFMNSVIKAKKEITLFLP